MDPRAKCVPESAAVQMGQDIHWMITSGEDNFAAQLREPTGIKLGTVVEVLESMMGGGNGTQCELPCRFVFIVDYKV